MKFTILVVTLLLVMAQNFAAASHIETDPNLAWLYWFSSVGATSLAVSQIFNYHRGE
jgi:hypothetical protein